MKKLILLCLLVPTLAFAGLDHIEIGQFFTRAGQRVSALYEVQKGQYTLVHLIMPDGREIQVDVEQGTKAATLDRSLQQIVNEQ